MAATLLGLPAVAVAQTPDPGTTATTSTTLSLLGTGLTVEVVRDADNNIQSVNLDASGTTTVDEQSAHEVEFTFDGSSTEVNVQVEGDQLTVQVESAPLADIAGPGTWVGDVFGSGDVVVSYTVSDSSGSPTVVIDGVTAPDGVGFEILTGDAGSAEVVFTLDGVQKTLSIEVDGGGSDAELQVSLEGNNSQGSDEANSDEQDSVNEEDAADQQDSVDEQEQDTEDSIGGESEESDDQEADATDSHEDGSGETSGSETSNG